MLVTESGIVRLLSELQPSNAARPMLITDWGSVKCASVLQPLNAASPILVTEVGILTLCMDLHPWKASEEISVVPSGIISSTGLPASCRSSSASCHRTHSTHLCLKIASRALSSERPLSATVAESSNNGFSSNSRSTTVTLLVSSSSSFRKASMTRRFNSPTVAVDNALIAVTSPPAAQMT